MKSPRSAAHPAESAPRRPGRAPGQSAAGAPPAGAVRRPVGTFFGLTESFKRSLLAENKSPRTVQTYGEGLRLFGEFLVREQLPTDAEAIKREHVEAFIGHLLERWKPATANNRYRALHAFSSGSWQRGRSRHRRWPT